MFQKILSWVWKFPGKLKTLLLMIFSPKRPAIFSEDGLTTVHNHDFVNDERFMKAYLAGKATNSWGGAGFRWQAFTIAWAANKCASLDGDFVECGVNRGGSAMVAAMYVGFEKLNKTFYLLDTYNGLDERYTGKGESLRKYYYSECYEDVKETFRNFPNVKLVRGSVPDTLEQVTSNKICYLSIDMNTKIPEIAAAEYFWDKLVSGAVMVLDDYGWTRHIDQKLAFDQFAAERGVQVLALPTGQGLIFKP